MAAALLPETAPRLLTPEVLRTAAKQSQGIHLVPISLRRAIKRYLRDQDKTHMHRKVLMLSSSFERAKGTGAELTAAATRGALLDDPHAPAGAEQRTARWKVQSSYGDTGLQYREDETVAYVASRMPAIYAACHRVLREVRRRSPDFAPKKVLDFGAGPSSALWAMRAVWPKSIERVNLVEPSKEMQRAGQTLLDNLKGLPLIHSYDSIQELNRTIEKHERGHDLVISSYALGEIPSLSDRITIVRQLWDLTKDVLVLLEPGTPQGSKIISQMRSYILWMEKRKCRKSEKSTGGAPSKTKNIVHQEALLKNGAFVVAPCPHDGRCPLENSDKYCHFVQRLERTSSQRIYKRSKGVPLRGFEDEKFCYVALRRGKRPEEAWPLDGMKFDTLKERHAKRNPEDLIIDYEEQFPSEEDEETLAGHEDSLVPYTSDTQELSLFHESREEEDEPIRADLGGGWGRIIYSPIRRGRQVQMDVCRATKRDASEGAFERVVVTQSKNPALHLQARRSLWGDLWPF
ncbi:probable S-adenosyl-L-methionine-dependent RNA methyltransferase RSM22, mitochondrial [Brachypodium distachyon]|uniref:Methyltransferase-like protein 17, mitochondrial n=1 Tax=Brachypodium distachyon TaxID=15368 RepID=I1I5H2_BRADI|nr:probable S-adenosyl-L-methionine-dependent RNA methyltransferase RSM22, mitochondrial [Brachypodium distachyon]KQJ97493.1 hypothetical protein BRADI_3g31397v3 [Brachypodium distachyon]|eukprot:XP_003571978.2 probable S-adenosyl-L-methionine-dependent RNA methyltransferase RSM22, mitochondrial [Brachypodium distachyon]